MAQLTQRTTAPRQQFARGCDRDVVGLATRHGVYAQTRRTGDLLELRGRDAVSMAQLTTAAHDPINHTGTSTL